MPETWAITLFGCVWSLVVAAAAWIIIDTRKEIRENEKRAAQSRHDIRDLLQEFGIKFAVLQTQFGAVEKQMVTLSNAHTQQTLQQMAVMAAAAMIAHQRQA